MQWMDNVYATSSAFQECVFDDKYGLLEFILIQLIIETAVFGDNFFDKE